MATWDLKQLRDLIKAYKGEREDLNELVNGIGNGIDVFRYHLYTARDALKPFVEKTHDVNLMHLKYLFGTSNNQDEYELAKLSNQANVIAAIYTARSLFDIFSQLVRGCFLENMKNPDRCNIYDVLNNLEQGDLRDYIDELLNSNEFKYVNDFANVSKHRSMIKFGTSINFNENKAGVRFCAFVYNNRKYPEMWSNDIIELVLKVNNTIVDAGTLLNNEILRAIA